MAMNENYAVDRELNWDDAIENDGPEFILLPEGDYDFVVDHFDRERHNGSEKLPPCWKAVVYLKIETPQGVANVRHNLFLHTKTEGMLCAFFTAIGQRQHGQRITMNWNAVSGARGRAKIGIREYQGRFTCWRSSGPTGRPAPWETPVVGTICTRTCVSKKAC